MHKNHQKPASIALQIKRDTVQSQYYDMDSFVHVIASDAFRLYRLKYLQHMHDRTWHFGDEPFQAIGCTTDKLTTTRKNYTKTSYTM